MIRELNINNLVFDYNEQDKPAEFADSGDTIIFNSYDFVLNKLTDSDVLSRITVKVDLIKGRQEDGLCLRQKKRGTALNHGSGK